MDRYLLMLLEIAGLVIAVYLIPFIVKSIKDKTDNEVYIACLDELEHVAKKAVVTTTQTYVRSMKEQDAFDANAQRKAFNMTKTALLAMLSEEAYEILSNRIGDIDTYIQNLIESNVYEEKQKAAFLDNLDVVEALE